MINDKWHTGHVHFVGLCGRFLRRSLGMGGTGSRRTTRRGGGRDNGGRRIAIWLEMVAILSLAVSGGRAAEPGVATQVALKRIFDSGVPTSVEELQLMDSHQRDLIRQLAPLTVGLELGPTQGSGVLISEDGLILTAAHVAGEPNQRVTIWTSDGQQYRGKTLGMNKDLDAGLIKIVPSASSNDPPKKWPHAELADTRQVRPGMWCMALGHPGGFQRERQPVARCGRVLNVNSKMIESDCILIGGDSGGPLFDMDGRVVGIHSRIGSELSKNLHVPAHAYRDSWDRLVRGEAWGNTLNLIGRPVIGILGDGRSDLPKIVQVRSASPAQAAGLKPGDMVLRIGDEDVKSFGDIKVLVGRRNPGDEVVFTVQRGDQVLKLAVEIGSERGE
jgi:serine protease Do